MGHVTYFMKLWDPFHISGMFEGRNFQLGTQFGHWVPKKCKIRAKVDLLFEIWHSLHISGTVEARNFKFGYRLATEDTNEKMQN